MDLSKTDMEKRIEQAKELQRLGKLLLDAEKHIPDFRTKHQDSMYLAGFLDGVKAVENGNAEKIRNVMKEKVLGTH